MMVGGGGGGAEQPGSHVSKPVVCVLTVWTQINEIKLLALTSFIVSFCSRQFGKGQSRGGPLFGRWLIRWDWAKNNILKLFGPQLSRKNGV